MTGATELRRATGSNTVPIQLAAGVAAWAGILLNPTRCALLMNMSTVILAFDAMLLSRRTTGLTTASGGRTLYHYCPSAEGAPIRVRLWFILLALAGAACGGGTTDATQTTAGASGPDLSGLSLEVHQAPG